MTGSGHGERVVVVGNGMAGLKFVEELTARAGERFAVTVIGAEPQPAYNRVLLSAVLAGDMSEDDCRLRDRDWYAARGVALVTGTRATAIDTAARLVVAGRKAHAYDRLVLATGSEPIRLPLPGLDLPGVHAFRDLADLAAIRDRAVSGGRAVVIGGGLLGIEAAYGLARRGAAVTLVHLMDRLMERQLDVPAAALVRRALERQGIAFELTAESAAILGETAVEGLRLKDGRVLACDMVVMAVGVRAAAGLAADAGIAVARGVQVDDHLATSAASVHAIGECAEHRGICYGLVEPGYDQARILARRFAGEDVAYRGTSLATNLKVSGVPVFSAGVIDDRLDRVTLSDPAIGVYRKLVFDGDRLIGAVLAGDTADGPFYHDLIRTGRPARGWRGDLVFGRAFIDEAA